MRNWLDVLPKRIAAQQVTYEREKSVLRMRAAGLTYRECGARLGVSAARAAQMAQKAQLRLVPPVVRYYDALEPELRPLIEREQKRQRQEKRMLRMFCFRSGRHTPVRAERWRCAVCEEWLPVTRKLQPSHIKITIWTEDGIQPIVHEICTDQPFNWHNWSTTRGRAYSIIDISITPA